MKKRLFLFAAYDPKNEIVDASTIAYVRALQKLGDVVFFMDNDVSVSRVKPYTVYAGAQRHGEYDFGSYKRGYLWAKKIIKNYDWVYLVNDSVYLLGDIKLSDLEKNDANGMVYNSHSKKSELQSWFIGLSRPVFMSRDFDTLMQSVEKQTKKSMITHLYEDGITRMLERRGWKFSSQMHTYGHAIYNKPKRLFRAGLPFMKKVAFARRNGLYGRQILYILNHIKPHMRDLITADTRRVYGEKYVAKMLTNNIIKITWRNIKYSLHKIFGG